jgi:hypothetical protein
MILRDLEPKVSYDIHGPSILYNPTLIFHVVKQPKRINPSKSAGPDGVKARGLEVCANQLAFIQQDIFNLSPPNTVRFSD